MKDGFVVSDLNRLVNLGKRGFQIIFVIRRLGFCIRGKRRLRFTQFPSRLGVLCLSQRALGKPFRT